MAFFHCFIICFLCKFTAAPIEVFFSVSPNQPRGYAADERITFDHVWSNKWAGWKIGQNEFVCDYPSFYLFTLSIMPNHGEYADAHVMIDDDPRGGPLFIYQ